MRKHAFTMMELVFVIVVIGILAATIIPRLERDTLYEAGEQLLSHIRYTQHLAMIDNVYDDKDVDWYRSMWQIKFSDCSGSGIYYVVYSDKDQAGNADEVETAIDPTSHKRLYSSTSCTANDRYESSVILTDEYGLDDVILEGGCFSKNGNTNKYVAFDHMGRPFFSVTSASDVVTTPCAITIVDGDENATITITPETGYAHITYN